MTNSELLLQLAQKIRTLQSWGMKFYFSSDALPLLDNPTQVEMPEETELYRACYELGCFLKNVREIIDRIVQTGNPEFKKFLADLMELKDKGDHVSINLDSCVFDEEGRYSEDDLREAIGLLKEFRKDILKFDVEKTAKILEAEGLLGRAREQTIRQPLLKNTEVQVASNTTTVEPLTLQLAEKIRIIRDQYNAAYQLFNQEEHTVPAGLEEKLKSCLPLLEDGISLAAKIKNEEIMKLLMQLKQKTNKVFSGEKSIVRFFWDETVGIRLKALMEIADKLEIAGRIEQQAGQAAVTQGDNEAVKITGTAGDTDKPEKKLKLLSKNDTASLEIFIEKYCKDYGVISSKVKTLQSYARKKKLKLPKLAIKWERGQAKLYYIKDLIRNWSSYRKVFPSLPELK